MKKIIYLLLLLSASVQAVNVDKMLITAIDDDEEKSQITVINSDNFPVFVKIELTELINNEEMKFNSDDFKHWPIYLDKNELIIDPKSRIKVTVNNLLKALGTTIKNDRVVGISFIPQTYQEDEKNKSSLSVLTGFKVWYIIPHNKAKVLGNAEIKQDKKKLMLVNNTDTTLQFYIDSCGTSKDNPKECSDSVLVLPKRMKDVTFDASYHGVVIITTKDLRKRYRKEFKIIF
ncbi:hypothetical protein [Photobacterium damselae]|uniref:hypothetical protein n=1 Tax=Photobacterium damselae TaxID=38293 RepID=UPI0035A89DC3